MFLLGLIYATAMFMGPFLVIYIIPYVESSEVNYKTVIKILSILISSKAISTICKIQIQLRLKMVGMKMKTQVDAAIFAKVLRFSLLRTTDYSPGDLVNLLIVDTLKIFQAV